MDYNTKYQQYLTLFNNAYNKEIENFSKKAPKTIKESMIYATCDGGKRVRPVLCFALADALGISFEEVEKFAIAIEFIHSYSLVHDDLPSMDNDDYRRGKLSTHKKFGEAYGVLCGDALLNYAFETCLDKPNFNHYDAQALKIIAEYAGYSGMIGGQVLDLQNEKNPVIDENVLYDIYINKTSKLLTAPLLVCSALCGGKYFEELKTFGYNLGFMFQITDDLLDEEGDLTAIGKTPHKDRESDKFTSIKVFGLEGAKNKAKEHYQTCLDVLKKIPNTEFLCEFTDKIYLRKK